MVENSDIRLEFNLFADIWTTYKSLLPVGLRDDEAYWQQAVRDISAVMDKYPGQLAKDLALAILGDLERRCAEIEDQNAGF